MPKVIKLIESYEKRGEGTQDDPIREIYQLHDFDGKLIHEAIDHGSKFCSDCGVQRCKN